MALSPRRGKWPAPATFNRDGNLDIFWQNSSTGERGIWLLNGTTHIAKASLGNVPTTWRIVGSNDFNRDGQLDIIWQNNAGDRYIWFMNGTTYQTGLSLGNVAPVWNIRNF